MPKDSRARTRAVRTRMAFTGETYTQARAGLAAPPRMDRDTPPDGLVAALMFGELMAAGRRAAVAAPADLAAAAAAVHAAIAPLWPQVVPEAARDVLVACAQLAVTRGITALPAGIEDETAASMLELTAAQPASGSPGTARRVRPARRLRQLGRVRPRRGRRDAGRPRAADGRRPPAADVVPPEDWPADNEDWPAACPECGGDDPKGTYGCECWNPAACSECGDPNGDCDCWI